MRLHSVGTRAARIRFSVFLILAILGSATLAAQKTREAQVKTFLEVIRDVPRHSEQEVAEAINQLGQLRATESIDDLVKLLSFKQTFWWEKSNSDAVIEIRPVTTAGRYPAVGALFSIGEPALPALTRVIVSESGSSLRVANALEAIGLIFREKTGGAVNYLSEAALKVKGTGASRLRAAAKKLEAHQKARSIPLT